MNVEQPEFLENRYLNEVRNFSVIEEVRNAVSIIADEVFKNYIKFDENTSHEVKELLKLLNFENDGKYLFRRWYIEGRLYFHVIIDEKNPEKGIMELRNIDPRRMKKIDDYFYYNSKQDVEEEIDINNCLKLHPDRIIYTTSGLKNLDGDVVSWLNKSMKIYKSIKESEMDYYLCKRFYNSLNVPIYFNLFKGDDETSSGEVKFARFCNSISGKFLELVEEVKKRQNYFQNYSIYQSY